MLKIVIIKSWNIANRLYVPDNSYKLNNKKVCIYRSMGYFSEVQIFANFAI